MSNLKKILALVLALVMSFSLVTVSNAAYADLKDTDQVSEEYVEAVRVLCDMGIFQGDNLGNFNPKAPITRQEVAAMMYRVISTDVTDTYDRLYIEACDFEDGVATWAKGFVGYCANGGYIKGVGGKNFAPTESISGIAVLAMILRAVGYDKNNEFTGPEWDKNVLAVATSLGILKNVDETVVSLGQPASRELVAELIFRTMVMAQKVTYTPAFGYQTGNYNFDDEKSTIGKDNFNLTKSGRIEIDQWGRPGYKWTFNVGTTFTTFADAYKAAYTTAVTECCISDEAYAGKDAELFAFINGVKNTTANGKYTNYYTVDNTDVVTTWGGQGRLMEFYSDRVVIIDTFLAKVEQVVDIRYDARNHAMNAAALSLTVYDGSNTPLTLTKTSNWEYKKGDYVLLNTRTDNNNAADTVVLNNVGTGHGVVLGNSTTWTSTVVQLAPSFTGKQTVIHYTADKHTIDGTTYDDAMTFYHDEAGQSKNLFTWFKDTYGNVIGSVIVPATYTYGTIKDIQWFTQAGDYGYAQATMVMHDGSTKTVVVAAIATTGDVNATNTAMKPTALSYANNLTPNLENGLVATEFSLNYDEFAADHLYQIIENGDGTVTLAHVANPFILGTVVGAEYGANDKTVEAGDAFMLGYNFAAGNKMLVNENTQFLFAYDVYADGSYVIYSAYTGFNSVPEYVNCTIDYVDLNGDFYADVVYVNGQPADAESSKLFYVSTASNTYEVAGKYYVVTGYINGTFGELKTKSATIRDTLMANVNELYVAEVVNGYVVGLTNDTNAAVGAANVLNGAYKFASKYYNALGVVNSAVKYDDADATFTKAEFDGEVLRVTVGANEFVYDVTAATRVIGELKVGVNYANGYSVHVVYTNVGDKDVTEVYVFETPGANDGGDVTPNFTGYTAAYTTGNLVIAKANGYAVAANTPVTVDVYVGNVYAATVNSLILQGQSGVVMDLSAYGTAGQSVVCVVSIGGVSFNVTGTR